MKIALLTEFDKERIFIAKIKIDIAGGTLVDVAGLGCYWFCFLG